MAPSIRATSHILYNQGPALKEKEKLSYVSQPLDIKHCPEDKKPTTVKEFLEVCKKYTEVVINTKTKRPGGWTHDSYRCLFSKPKPAQKLYDDTYKKLQSIKQQEALAQLNPNSKWKEEIEALGAEEVEE